MNNTPQVFVSLQFTSSAAKIVLFICENEYAIRIH